MGKTNIAFKCNYCNGGSGDDRMHYGYNGVCTPGVIEHNIKKMKYEWCTHPRCDCNRFYKGEISYEQLNEIYREEGFVCYESSMLKHWEARAGWDNKGKRGDRPRRIRTADIASLAILTLVTPNATEDERRIFALFLIDDYYEGDDESEGYVSNRSGHRLQFTRRETNDLRFWDYYANENTAERRWSSGLFRYISDESAAQILKQAMMLRRGSDDEDLANEMFERFCKTKGIDAL